MSNIKDLFNSKKTDKLLENSTGREIGDSVESADYLKSNVKDKKRFIPHVDFSSASNFAVFGSAEKYYEDSYNYVLKQYPYDGSLKEKINWSLSGTYLDRYIFENEYPRTTGYVNMGQSYNFNAKVSDGYDSSNKNEWIYFKGHNVDHSLNTQTNPKLTLQFDNLNIYNTASQGLSNLQLEGSGGVSTEFWLHKQSFDNSVESRRQVVFDLWNSASFGTNGYGRFRIEISGTTTADALQPNFQIELLSGSAGFSSATPSGEVPTIILSGSTLTGSWNHFALTFENTGSQMIGRLYTNGGLTYTHQAGTTMGLVTGSMLGQIGSLVTAVSGTMGVRGYGKLSGSLDEFRFWKTRRTAKQIGQHWFTQVGGGTNTDLTLATSASTKYSYENPADLGVYYKFNEGIINTSSINPKDAVVIDFAGRVTNGEWEGYSLTSRNTGSAIISASAASFEFRDPILYSSHPLVSNSLTDKKNVGSFYDVTNNSSMYRSLPNWITADDQNKGTSALRNLTQIMASYFDTLYLQTQTVTTLKDKDYISGSNKPFPFLNRFIDSSGFLTSEIFTKASDLEYLDARNDKKLFLDKINELKNLIYQNIYNNLVYIYKTKGTEKSFRNLIRGFGVDKELINIKLYGNQVTYKLLDNYDNATVRKRYVDFYSGSRVDAVVYQQTASGNSYSRGYISSSAEVQYRGNAYELETFFTKDREKGTNVYFNAAFQTASIFGCHTSGAAGSTAWGSPDYGQFQVQSVRPDIRRKAAYFQLTCSNDGAGVIPKLTSSVFQDVYDGTRWNFAVQIKPKKYPLAAGVSGSDAGQYDVEFSGYNYVLDILNNSFLVTASVAASDAQNFLKANKRFFVGSHRTNTTGTVLQQTNVKATSLRVWMNYLTSSVLQIHAKDVTNFGSANPYRDAYITEQGTSLGSKNVKNIPELETLILNWNFDTLSSSDAGGNFTVPDVSVASSGTNDYTTRWGWLGPIGQYQHTGYGFGFPSNDTGSIDRRYVHSLILQPPENINSSNMISLIDKDQNALFVKDSRPENYFFAFEKSMYEIITREIIDIFGTIVEFNNLIGEPVNRYRQEYKSMEKLRQLYFERVQNTIDLEKFVEYFKWLDSALAVMLQQLVPAGAKFSENLRTMVEGHVLERNKYWNKFPTLEMKVSDPEAGLFGITEMLYPYKRGHAPALVDTTGSAACVGWKNLDGITLRGSGCGGIYKTVGGISLWNTWANADPIGVDSSVTFQGKAITNGNKVGLKTTPGEQGDEDLIDFSFYFDGATSTLYIREDGLDPTGGLSWSLTTYAHQWRITRNIGGDVFYQKSEDAGLTFTTIYTSTKTTTDILYPVISMERPGASSASGLENAWIHPINRTNTQCFWWKNRAPARLTTAGDATIDNQRDTFRLAGDFRSASGPTLAVSRNSTANTTTYTGQAYALRDFTRIIRLNVNPMDKIHGGSNFAHNKTVEYTHEALKFGSSQQLEIAASSIPEEFGCYDVIIPNSKLKLEAKVTNTGDPYGYTSGKSEIFAPFSLFSSSVTTGYVADVATNFRTKTEIDNYHDDIYGDDKGIPAQGPFTERHVGGRQHRHLDVNTSSATTTLTRAEAWNLSLASNTLTISPRTVHQPRATMIRDAYAKRPLNIANIKWGTSSANAGNYRFGYEVLQTSGRRLNNRFFVMNGGFAPTSSDTGIFSGAIDYALPRYDLTGTNKSIFVERFNAPGGAEVSSRGCMDVNAEEYSVYNNLNYRNLIVREALNSWQTEHCGQFGIDPTGSPGDGTTPGEHMVNPVSYGGVIAAYHKVNRNPIQTCLVKSGYDRYVNWLKLNGEITFDRTTSIISKPAGASNGWNAGAIGNEKLPRNGYLSFEVTNISDDQIIGLNSNPPAGASYGDMDYSIQVSAAGPGNVYVYQNGTAVVNPASFQTAVGEIFKIAREGTTIYYQRSVDGGKNFVTFYTSLIKSTADLYPDITLWDAGAGVSNVKISNPQYDNWFVRHTLPQSTLQYRWIKDSYDKTKSQPLGYVGGCHDAAGLVPFSVPSGTTSVTQSAVQFVTKSCWNYDWALLGGCSYYVNFAQYYFQWNWPAAYYKYTITPSTNTVTPGWVFSYNNVGTTINAHFNNLNGPYGYPTWKQIRTGETPVARYHKRNNILSIMSPIDPAGGKDIREYDLPYHYLNAGDEVSVVNTRRDNFTNFIEPPVTFQYRPLITTMNSTQVAGDPPASVAIKVPLLNTYANNKCLWSEGIAMTTDSTTEMEVTQSIADYLLVPNEINKKQIYDKIIEDSALRNAVSSISYKEIVYPRGMNAGLAKVRGRTQYAEVANGTLAWEPSGKTYTFSASLSDGTNGIDRGPQERRTFWRNAEYYRNRREGWQQLSQSSVARNYDITGTLPNSQGYKIGGGTSVLGFGRTPLSYRLTSVAAFANIASGSGLALSTSHDQGMAEAPQYFPDTGELNSANYQFFSSFAGTAAWSNLNALSSSIASRMTWAPSASALYYHLPVLGPTTGHRDLLMAPLRWQTAEISGKKPWFDSYEEYAEDIRGNGKSYTIIPEFRMSDHMNYYVVENARDFKIKNDKFLSLNGGNITSSADTEWGNKPTADGKRYFNKTFFNEYSNSDFQKYFGKFYNHTKPDKITLRARGIKKLLPYNGFYPQQRSLQLASMFSQSMCPKISGGSLCADLSETKSPAWIEGGPNTSARLSSARRNSGSLAVQSLLQPFFAPGILYNTIKSGIAVNWPAYTGSLVGVMSASNLGAGRITLPGNYLVPFESILDPLGLTGIPRENATTPANSRLYLTIPTYMTGNVAWTLAGGQANLFTAARAPFVILTGSVRNDTQTKNGPYGLYQLAMSNFLAEIPNFFLNNGPDGQFKKIVSTAEASEIHLTPGTRYYMDIYLNKSTNLVMMEESDNEVNRDFNGRLFGPPASTRCSDDTYLHDQYQVAPAFAPYTPPYFYGRAKMVIEYVAAANDDTNFRFGRFFANLTASYTNMLLERMFPVPGGVSVGVGDYMFNATGSAAGAGRMHPSASINIRGIVREPGNLADTSVESGKDKWVISPRMETPVLDFSSNTSQTPYPRGMWGGYGEFPTGGKALTFGIDNTYTSQQFAASSDSGSLIEIMFGGDATPEETIGEMGTGKDISEAIVAIPYIEELPGSVSDPDFVSYTENRILGRHFISLGEDAADSSIIFTKVRECMFDTGWAISANHSSWAFAQLKGVTQGKERSSIGDLVTRMNKYQLPPELDFNINDGVDPLRCRQTDPAALRRCQDREAQNRTQDPNFIEPFVMYIMEFNHHLSRQDLVDIWQGLMPKISTTAEEAVSEVIHPNEPLEFFGGKRLPEDIRWMVFKVKKRANFDYYAATPDIRDNNRSEDLATYSSKHKKLTYSYNWPYDYFSLVELAELEVVENEPLIREEWTAVMPESELEDTSPPAPADNPPAPGTDTGTDTGTTT